MSYDITLNDPVTHEAIRLDAPHEMRGGTYAINGTDEAWLNITYNYSGWYYKDGVFPSFPDERFSYGRSGIRSIYGMTGAESIPVLKHAIEAISRMPDISDEEKARYESKGCDSYWMPTRDNAIRPLYQLIALAQLRPDGIFSGD